MAIVETYFIAWKGRRDGPYSLVQLAELLERGEIGLLHRVETSSGLLPLRDLLLADDPERWGNSSSTPPEPPARSTPPGLLGSAPTRGTAARDREPILDSRPATDDFPSDTGENLDDDQARQIYTICGLCFLVPPLVGLSWKIASDLSGRGFPQTARRLKWISSSLAASGLLLWGLLWWMW